MITEEDKKRIIEAKGCESCPNWHKYCQAECCKMTYIKVDPKLLNDGTDFFYCQIDLTEDEIWYWSLRGIKYENGFLIIDKKNCIGFGEKVAYLRNCEMLTKDNRCTGHPNDKPMLCKKMTAETVMAGDKSFIVTDNCLFKYKKMEKEVKSNG